MTAATRIVQHVLGQGYSLIVDQEQPVLDGDAPMPPIVSRDPQGRHTLDLSHPHITLWIAQLGYEITGTVVSRVAITQTLITLEGVARYGRTAA